MAKLGSLHHKTHFTFSAAPHIIYYIYIYACMYVCMYVYTYTAVHEHILDEWPRLPEQNAVETMDLGDLAGAPSKHAARVRDPGKARA